MNKIVYRATYDKSVDAVYLYLRTDTGSYKARPEEVELPNGIPFWVDFAKIDGVKTLVGFEFLFASKIFSEDFLKSCEQLEK